MTEPNDEENTGTDSGGDVEIGEGDGFQGADALKKSGGDVESRPGGSSARKSGGDVESRPRNDSGGDVESPSPSGPGDPEESGGDVESPGGH